MSIDDYLDGLLSDTAEPSKKAIMKLTKLIENFGEIMVKSTERMEDYIDTLTNRINAIEHALGGSSRAPAPSAEPSFDSPVAAPAAAAAAPNLTASNSSPVAAPNLSATVGTPDLSGGGNPEPSGSQGTTGSGISSADIMKAASNLQKAPEPTPGDPGAPEAAPVFSPFGVSATDIQDVRSGLTKVDPDEHRKERAAAAGGTEGSMPASLALNLEVKDALSKRKSRTDEGEDAEFEPTPAAPASPQKSTKQMKEALQGELRDAFSSLLESDTKED
ncbi:MAG: hypothetical protein ACTSO5_03315 [Candidatus Heimdallarchaeaceae archaeon]